MSIIKAKLPSSVIQYLEIWKGIEGERTVTLLKELLKEYGVACEKTKMGGDTFLTQI